MPALLRKRSDGLQVGGGEGRKDMGWLSPQNLPLGWVSSHTCSESQEDEMSVFGGGLRCTFHVSSLRVSTVVLGYIPGRTRVPGVQ